VVVVVALGQVAGDVLDRGPFLFEERLLDGDAERVWFQLVDDRTLKVETFPGKTASQVEGFTASALIYER